MLLAGIVRCSLNDYPGKPATCLFTQGCNMRCPYCHNSELIGFAQSGALSMEKLLLHLERRKKVQPAVVVTGGEPTLQKDLIPFLKSLKEMGLDVKLDSNGSNPHVLQKVIEARCVDYIAMDVKAPFENYSTVAGVDIDTALIEESIKILISSSIDYEFRTTVIPGIHSEEDLLTISRYLEGGKRYILQTFLPTYARASEYKEKSITPNAFLREMSYFCSRYIQTTWR